MRVLLLFTALMLATVGAAAEWFRYTPPPRGTLILDTVLSGGAQEATLRLPKIGRYYVELLRERGPAGEDAAAGPLAARLDMTVMRGKRVLLEKRFEVSYGPEDRARTLLWLDVPDRLPARSNLAVTLALSGPSEAELAATPLRLQINRKIDLLPLPTR